MPDTQPMPSGSPERSSPPRDVPAEPEPSPWAAEGSGGAPGGAVTWDTQPLQRPQPVGNAWPHQAQAPQPWSQQPYPPAPAPPPQQPYDPYSPGSQPASWDDAPPWSGPATTVDTLGRPERPRRGGAGIVVLAVLLALVAGLVGGVIGGVAAQRSDLAGLLGTDDSTGTGEQGDGSAAAEGSGAAEPLPPGETGSVAEIAARVLPSVVSIRVSTGQGAGTGSGFVIDAEGLIVTNNHVIAAGGTEPADQIVVELGNGSQVEAEVVGTEASYDIAVLRIDPDEAGPGGLVALPWGDSDQVVVGEQVVAVGAPLGLDSTVTTGIVSALNRPVSAGDAQQTAFINAIQTDAAINPGNSGGPLVNLRGEVVGVNSAIAQAPGGRTGGSIGLGFSIPSNQAQRTAGELVEDGVATFPVIGVLLDRTYTGEGVRIVSEDDATDSAPVVPGGPADQAGLLAGDVILAFEGRPMTESDELVVAIRAREPGDEVTLTVRRGDEVFDVDVVLEAGDQG
jgi:putative serine protease PepD